MHAQPQVVEASPAAAAASSSINSSAEWGRPPAASTSIATVAVGAHAFLPRPHPHIIPQAPTSSPPLPHQSPHGVLVGLSVHVPRQQLQLAHGGGCYVCLQLGHGAVAGRLGQGEVHGVHVHESSGSSGSSGSRSAARGGATCVCGVECGGTTTLSRDVTTTTLGWLPPHGVSDVDYGVQHRALVAVPLVLGVAGEQAATGWRGAWEKTSSNHG